jgi:hypothetical protein
VAATAFGSTAPVSILASTARAQTNNTPSTLGTKTPDELLFFEELGETLKDLTIRDDEIGFARQLQDIGITLKDGFQFERLDARRRFARR